MDAQMKRGFLEACVLAVLSRGESYGYQIIKDVPPSLGLTDRKSTRLNSSHWS